VIGTAWEAFEVGARVFFVFNNPADLLVRLVQRSRDVIREPGILKLELTTGPMAVCGSTRMQATTIELLVVGAALERALERVLAKSVPADCIRRWHAELREPEAYGRLFRDVLTALERDGAVAALADAARREVETYRAGGLVTYVADAFMADVLTDTTERSPTFTLPPFRKCDDSVSPLSWAFLKDPLRPTPEAWRAMLGREPRGLDWGPEVYRRLGVPSARKLDRGEVLKFRIGNEDDPSRRESPRSVLVLVDAEDGWPGQAERATRLAEAFERMAAGCGTVGALMVGEAAGGIPVAPVPSPLRLSAHLALKLSLNVVSTATMAAMGRVRGNAMIFAEATNKKLIDRGTRMVAGFAGLSYERACVELHRTIWQQRAERAAGGKRRSPVAATIERLEGGR
jgi:N-acetylmuramic acid 6-phosphate etherase